MADLRVVSGSFSYAPANPTVGDEVLINVTVENVGDADCEAGFDVEYFLNDTDHPFKPGENEIEFPPLPKADTWNVSQWMGTNDLASGVNYTILIVVDFRNEVNESDESNNNLSANLSLGPRLYPELYIPPGGVSVWPSQPLVGDNVTINATVMNNGEKSAKFVDVFFFVNDTAHQIGTYQIIGPVNVSEAKKATIVWNTIGLSPGNYTVLVMVNPPWDWNRMPERNFADNNASINVTLVIPQADLFLRNVTYLPQKPLVGQGVVVTGEVVNAGRGASELCNLSLFVDFNSTQAASVPVPPLRPKESRGFVLSWNSSGISAALHRMRLIVDPDYVFMDSNQTNNSITWTMGFEGVVDLSLDNLTISPPSPRLGDTVHFSITVVNAGTLRCNSANLTLRMTGYEADRKQLMTLSAGGQMSSSLKWSTAGLVAGSYDYEVSVAPGPGENDSEMGNNIIEGQLVVLPVPPMPDLLVSSVTLVPAGPARNGDTIKVVVTVENAGDLDANGSFLDIKLETPNGGLINFTDSPMVVPAIPAGRSATVNVSRDTQNYRAGNYSLKVAVDFRGDLAESNESNNIFLMALNILEALPKLPKLGIEEPILEGRVEEGQKLNIFVVINNTGQADAMNVVVSFIIDGKLQGTAVSISVISKQSNRTAAWPWVPTAGKHTITVEVTAEGVSKSTLQRSVQVAAAPSGSNPYILAAVIAIMALVVGAVLYLAIVKSRRPAPRIRLLQEEDEAGDEDDPQDPGEEGEKGYGGKEGQQEDPDEGEERTPMKGERKGS
jgi:subtilase family serine protease